MLATLTHINFDVVQRSRGNCAVKIMAYDLCSRIQKHDGTTYNFDHKKSELVHAEVMLPEGAPASLYDPQALANACELSEKRSDSQTGRLLLVTCPRECPEHLRIPLARTIAQPYVEQGMGVVFAYHNTGGADGEEQPHFHFFLTTRKVTPDGLASRKSPEWDRLFRERLPASEDDPKPKSGTAERARICDRANTFFAQHDLQQIRLDPRRLEQQGILDRSPEPDVPRNAWQQYKREGQAPPSVARVLRRRELRKQLAAIAGNEQAMSIASDKSTIAEDNERKQTMIPWEQDNEGYDPLLPDEKYKANMSFQKFQKMNPERAGMDIKDYVQMRQAEFAKSQNKETKMQNKPVKDDSRPAAMNMHYPVELWMEREGGLDALSQAMRDNAAVSFEHWVEDSKTEAQKVKRKNYGLRNYCNYVQEKFAERRAAEMKGQTAKTSAPNAEAKPPSQSKKAVRPRHETEETKREFVSFVHKLLSEHYEVPEGLHDFVRRIDISKESGEAVLTLKSGGKLIDKGSEITTDAEVNEALAAATVATAHARGWTSLTVTGSDEYRYAIAKAAALHEPPINTDVLELPRAIQNEIQEALVERARTALKSTGNTNSVARATKTPGQPNLSAAQLQATAALDRAQARQQAELAGEPKGQIDAKALAEPRIAELQRQLEAARLAAEEARQAADDHAREFPMMRRLMDQGARARHVALDAEASRLERAYGKMTSELDITRSRIAKEAAKEAKAAQRALDDWRYQPAVRRAMRSLADIERLRHAVAAADTAILTDINAGKITDAISKLPDFENSQTQKARAARTPEQIRGQAIDLAFAEADKCTRDPVRKERALEAIRAASDGDAMTIAALDSGKMDEAMRAAAAWRKKVEEEAAGVKRAKDEKETLERRLDPPQMAMPQP